MKQIHRMSEKLVHPGILVLFGVIFVLCGSFPGFIAVYDLRRARAAADWHETTATLLEVGMKESGNSRRRVVARYRYRAPDLQAVEDGSLREYEGDRIGIHSVVSDDLGLWQCDTYDRLYRAWQQGEAVPCWYDPADPAQAILDRSVRWEMLAFMFLFPLAFGLVGSAVAGASILEWCRRAEPRAPLVSPSDTASD